MYHCIQHRFPEDTCTFCLWSAMRTLFITKKKNWPHKWQKDWRLSSAYDFQSAHKIVSKMSKLFVPIFSVKINIVCTYIFQKVQYISIWHDEKKSEIYFSWEEKRDKTRWEENRDKDTCFRRNIFLRILYRSSLPNKTDV